MGHFALGTVKEIFNENGGWRAVSNVADQDSFVAFYYYFMPCVRGSVRVERHYRDPGSGNGTDGMATVPDEAFMLLAVENYYDKWHWQNTWGRNYNLKIMEGKSEQQAKTEVDGEMDPCPTARYTYETNRKNAEMYGGWKKKGLKRYKELCNLVTADRETHGIEAARRLPMAEQRESFDERFWRFAYRASGGKFGKTESGDVVVCGKLKNKRKRSEDAESSDDELMPNTL